MSHDAFSLLKRFYHNLKVFHETKANSDILPPRVSKKSEQGENFLWPMSYNLFWKSIKRSKGRGLRLTHLRLPHPCDMCTTLPGIEKQLKDARENLPTLLDPNERNKLCKHINILARKLKNRIAHAELLAHQRNWINKNVRDVLKVGQVFMQADYVTTYNVYGKPVHNFSTRSSL